jgi:hypothetical protein
MKKGKKAAGARPVRRAARKPRVKPPIGVIVVSSPPGRVETLPGYDGPRIARDLPHRLPPRVWKPIEGKRQPRGPKGSAATADVQIDGRSYTVDQTWSGLRFLFKVGALNVADHETFQNLFTTHIGRTIANVAHWTEIGIARFLGDGKYYLYTYDSEVSEDNRWNFFGHMRQGEVFEFAIRLHEDDPGPYGYQTFCSGRRVRTGKLPSLECQVDLSHESWSHTGAFSVGDNMIALEGWVNYPPSKARWYGPDLPIGFYSGNSAVKHVTLAQPFAHKMDSNT